MSVWPLQTLLLPLPSALPGMLRSCHLWCPGGFSASLGGVPSEQLLQSGQDLTQVVSISLSPIWGAFWCLPLLRRLLYGVPFSGKLGGMVNGRGPGSCQREGGRRSRRDQGWLGDQEGPEHRTKKGRHSSWPMSESMLLHPQKNVRG